MNTIKVILADEHPALRKGLRATLEMEDDIVVVAETSDGETTIRKVRELEPDVLVLDVVLPGKSGVEVVRDLSATPAPVNVLVLSAHDDENFIMAMIDAGVAGYLLKHESLEVIVEAVRGVAAGETGWFSRPVINKMLAAQKASQARALSEREKRILHYLARGWSNTAIGEALGISERTVRYHLRNIYDKIGVDSRGKAIVWGVRHGFDDEV